MQEQNKAPSVENGQASCDQNLAAFRIAAKLQPFRPLSNLTESSVAMRNLKLDMHMAALLTKKVLAVLTATWRFEGGLRCSILAAEFRRPQAACKNSTRLPRFRTGKLHATKTSLLSESQPSFNSSDAFQT